jgi:hypothetical protein
VYYLNIIKHLLPTAFIIFFIINTRCSIAQTKVYNTTLLITKPNACNDSVCLKPNNIYSPANSIVFNEAEVIGYNRYFHGINAKDYYYPNLSGNGIVVSIKENNVDVNDIDIVKRVLPSTLASGVMEDHATTIASIIGGAGNSFYLGKGIAPQVQFYPTGFNNVSADNTTTLLQQNVSVQNHSYGTTIQSFYGVEAASYDRQTLEAPHLVHVFSSGNRGTNAATDGLYKDITGFANLTGNFKMAKNVITVGALDTSGNIAPFASSGPLYDGRLAPQLTAVGANGTSDAAAMVSGAAVILQQQYKILFQNKLPTSGLIRALLFNSADNNMFNGINYKTGYGTLNILQALKILNNQYFIEDSLANLEVKNYTLQIPPNTGKLKITIVWNDTAANPNITTKALLNNIDMVVKDPNGNIFKPWVLSSFSNKDSLLKKSIRANDTLNNTEQITIDLPAAGQYTIEIKGAGIITKRKQPFHIAYMWDTLNKLSFIYPNQAQDINTNKTKQLPITWQCTVADTNAITGNIDVTYNNGISWNTIARNIKLYTQQFLWVPNDTNVVARFRITSSIGTVTSNNIFISNITKLQVQYVCNDSAKITWNKHILCNSYDVYALKQQAYLEKIATATDTFYTINRTANPYLIYAVQPVSNNRLATSRSRSIDIEQQGTNCYYTAFNAVEDKGTVYVNINVTDINFIDSIFFVKVLRGNVYDKPFALFRVSNTSSYNGIDNMVTTGTNTYIAFIKLKNGSIIQTMPISVTSTGSRNLILYPNPVTGNQTLQYNVKNTNEIFTLIVFNSKGSIVMRQQVNISGEIPTQKLATGIYFYTLLNNTNNTIQRGSFIKQ